MTIFRKLQTAVNTNKVFLKGANSAHSTSSSSVTLTLSPVTGTTPNNLLIALLRSGGVPDSWGIPSGFSSIGSWDRANIFVYNAANPLPASFNFTRNGSGVGSFSVILATFNASAVHLVGTLSSNATSATTITALGISPTTPGYLLYVAAYGATATSVTTSPSGMSLISTTGLANAGGGIMYGANQPATATGNKTLTFSGSVANRLSGLIQII